MQILNENVAHPGTTDGGITLTPHDSTGTPFDFAKVHTFNGPFGVSRGVVVDVGVAQRATGDSVATDAYGGYGPHGVEDFVEGGFVDGGVEVADVEGGGGEGSGLGGWAGGSCGGGSGGGGRFSGFSGHGCKRRREREDEDFFFGFLLDIRLNMRHEADGCHGRFCWRERPLTTSAFLLE